APCGPLAAGEEVDVVRIIRPDEGLEAAALGGRHVQRASDGFAPVGGGENALIFDLFEPVVSLLGSAGGPLGRRPGELIALRVDLLNIHMSISCRRLDVRRATPGAG